MQNPAVSPLTAALSLVLCLTLRAETQIKTTPPLSLIHRYELPASIKGHFDHFAADPQGQRLFGTAVEVTLNAEVIPVVRRENNCVPDRYVCRTSKNPDDEIDGSFHDLPNYSIWHVKRDRHPTSLGLPQIKFYADVSTNSLSTHPFGGNQSQSVAPVIDFMHKRDSTPNGLCSVIQNNDLEAFRRCGHSL